jgi:hypothetical protein
MNDNETKNIARPRRGRHLFFGATMAAGVGIAVALAACQASSTSPSTDHAAHTHAVSAATQYTCSMHPEIVSDAPGRCPKCGMTLVPKAR